MSEFDPRTWRIIADKVQAKRDQVIKRLVGPAQDLKDDLSVIAARDIAYRTEISTLDWILKLEDEYRNDRAAASSDG